MRLPPEALTRLAPLAALLLGACALHPPVWAPPAVSSPAFESHPAFDPWTNDLYFVRSTPAFEGWHLMVSRCTPGGWAPPVAPTFAAEGLEADPFFAEGGRTLYFISNRSTDGVHRPDLDLWRVDRTADGAWGLPRRLPEPLNSSGHEWFPRLAADGWLYFGSSRPGGLGGNDLWRAREAADGGWRVENLGPAVNTPGEEYEAEPSADGQALVLATGEGLFETRLTDGGWTPRRPLEVGLDPSDVGPLRSPAGAALLFARDTRGPASGELHLWRRTPGEQGWPPSCPPAAPR